MSALSIHLLGNFTLYQQAGKILIALFRTLRQNKFHIQTKANKGQRHLQNYSVSLDYQQAGKILIALFRTI